VISLPNWRGLSPVNGAIQMGSDAVITLDSQDHLNRTSRNPVSGHSLGHTDPALTLRLHAHLMPSGQEQTRKAVGRPYLPATTSSLLRQLADSPNFRNPPTQRLLIRLT
jgi:hypothetical protein